MGWILGAVVELMVAKVEQEGLGLLQLTGKLTAAVQSEASRAGGLGRVVALGS